MKNYLKKIFGHKFVALVDKLINTIDIKKNQIIIDDIEIKKDKSFGEDEYNKFLIQQTHKRGDLCDAFKIILEINGLLTLDEDNND